MKLYQRPLAVAETKNCKPWSGPHLQTSRAYKPLPSHSGSRSTAAATPLEARISDLATELALWSRLVGIRLVGFRHCGWSPQKPLLRFHGKVGPLSNDMAAGLALRGSPAWCQPLPTSSSGFWDLGYSLQARRQETYNPELSPLYPSNSTPTAAPPRSTPEEPGFRLSD